MTTKMKGIYKGFKYISQIFVVKDAGGGEMEIGYPTDIKHVAHIGWDGVSGTAPSWMNEFKNGPEFSPSSVGNIVDRRDSNPISFSPWSSQDFEQTMGDEQVSEIFKDLPPKLPSAPKKHKRKKTKSTSSPKSSTTKTSRSAKSKVDYCEINTSPRRQGV